MRRNAIFGAAALLAVVPATANAQISSTGSEVLVEKNTVVVVREAPKPSPITFTPYGFILLNAYFNDSVGNRNYPLPAPCTGGASGEGNVSFDVRQSRLGAHLSFNDKAGWTGATLGALVEGLVARFRARLGPDMKVIATGGLGEVIARHTDVLEIVDPWLTLAGLRLIWELNQAG